VTVQATQNVLMPSHCMGASTTVSSSAPPIMPDPSQGAMSSDPMAMIYELMSKQRNNDSTEAHANVEHNQQLEKAQQAEQAEAIKKQQEAEQQAASWGIFGKIASVIAIAVSAVASVCSCGAASALCAGACVLSAMAFAEGQAQILTKLTGNPDVDKAFQIGAGIAAAICSGGAGIANLGVSVAKTVAGAFEIAGSACTIGKDALSTSNDKGCQDASMALGVAGSACALGGAAAGAADGVGDVSDAAQKAIGAAADVTAGAAEVGSGVATIASSQYEADATDRGADAKQAELAIHRIQQLTQLVVDGLKESDGSHQRALQTLAGAMQTQAQTLVVASARV